MSIRLDSLAAQRIAAGLTVNDLAKAAGLSAIYVARGELGHPFTPDDVARLALALNCTAGDLGASDV